MTNRCLKRALDPFEAKLQRQVRESYASSLILSRGIG